MQEESSESTGDVGSVGAGVEESSSSNVSASDSNSGMGGVVLPPVAKRGRSVEEVVSLATATRDAVSTWVNRTKSEMNQMLAKHKEESVKMRAKAAQLQTVITEANRNAEALEKTQNERVQTLEERKKVLRAAECALRDVRAEQERLETAVANRTDSIAHRRMTAEEQIVTAEEQIQAMQKTIDLYGKRLGLSIKLVPDSTKKGATVLKVTFTLLDPRQPAAEASCMLFMQNSSFCGLL